MPTRRRTHRKPVLAPDENPDPIVDALTRGSADPERPADEVHKDATAGEAATGTPPSGARKRLCHRQDHWRIHSVAE